MSTRSPVVPSKPDLDLLPSKLRVSQSECPQLSSSSDSPPFPPSWLSFGCPIPTPIGSVKVHQLAPPYPLVSLPDYAESPAFHKSSSSESGKSSLSSFPGSDGSDMKAAHFPSLRDANSPKDGTACVSAHSKCEGAQEPSFEPSSQVENGVVLDQVKLPSIQLVGNLESNGPRNSYACYSRCGLESSLHSPLFVSPRPLNDIEELEVSGESRVIISFPPGDAHGEVAVKAPYCSSDVSFVCLNDATPAEEEAFEELVVYDAIRMDVIGSVGSHVLAHETG
ncbi:hypothetical protein Nepgr_006667 [Nepenthes gracilis]|uniref:Uncharacterized protein n=1 Tax=Nepenthes gracilis TaxID=150966 RepID=A0AAD3XHJ1_NEPGR|nr:hypothetical protein Nepgr_006667 [Nepenthes gracilis]